MRPAPLTENISARNLNIASNRKRSSQNIKLIFGHDLSEPNAFARIVKDDERVLAGPSKHLLASSGHLYVVVILPNRGNLDPSAVIVDFEVVDGGWKVPLEAEAYTSWSGSKIAWLVALFAKHPGDERVLLRDVYYLIASAA